MVSRDLAITPRPLLSAACQGSRLPKNGCAGVLQAINAGRVFRLSS